MTALVAIGFAALISSCEQEVVTRYDATATTIYTWQVEYVRNPERAVQRRQEEFASTSVVNQNGERPGRGVTGPDDQGLWWPDLPPRPTLDEVEERLRSGETADTPQLIQSVEYAITYDDGTRERTLPTNYSVYRQVVKAIESDRPLELTLSLDENSVVKAEPR